MRAASRRCKRHQETKARQCGFLGIDIMASHLVVFCPPMPDTTPLRNPDYRRLWGSSVVTVIGANLTIFAVPVQLYALTQNSAYVGLAGVFSVVPLIVFGLWGGAWADAMDRRRLLIIASCGLAVASVLLWVQMLCSRLAAGCTLPVW